MNARNVLLVITAVAAVARLGWPGSSPPGLNQDEAIGAWISWCLLKTGHDMNGQAWPIFYAHGIGDYPSTLFFYVTMAFQAIGGLNVTTTRLPAELAGIACVPLIYWVGARMFGVATGLIAAAMLALNPWHLFLSRFGVGASQCPLDALLTVALLLKARFPLVDPAPGEPDAEPDARWAGLAGFASGLWCYGFHPMKIYCPVLFLVLAIVLGPAWWKTARTVRGRNALLALALGFAATFGPLAWMHLVDSHIAHRWEMTRLWPPGAPLGTIVSLVLGRWIEHFGPDFLFVRGERFDIMRPIGQGEFGWYMLPLMLAGLGFVLWRFRASRAARVLAALLVAYPAGDVISRYIGVHALRSAPGVATLILLGAWGAAGIGAWLHRHRASWVPWAATVLVIAMAGFDGRFAVRFFGEWNRRPEIYHGYHADLMEAAKWLEPRLSLADAVFCTVTGLNEPWSILLVETRHDPRLWFSEPRDRRAFEYEVYVRYGKMFFMYGDLWIPYLRRLTGDGKPERVFFIVRPGELGLKDPAYVVRGPDGRDALWVVPRVL
jgi:4-amino-4-deoxy-L-arabinose transferase-like glycosyltransferase